MHNDTIQLLGDCSAGIEMALSTMDGILPNVKDQTMRRRIQESMHRHEDLRQQTVSMLRRFHGQERQPSSVVKSVAWLKTNARLALGNNDMTAADLIADGCDSGVRSLCRSRNRYPDADICAKDLAQQLIQCESHLSAVMRPYL